MKIDYRSWRLVVSMSGAFALGVPAYAQQPTPAVELAQPIGTVPVIPLTIVNDSAPSRHWPRADRQRTDRWRADAGRQTVAGRARPRENQDLGRA